MYKQPKHLSLFSVNTEYAKASFARNSCSCLFRSQILSSKVISSLGQSVRSAKTPRSLSLLEITASKSNSANIGDYISKRY